MKAVIIIQKIAVDPPMEIAKATSWPKFESVWGLVGPKENTQTNLRYQCSYQ